MHCFSCALTSERERVREYSEIKGGLMCWWWTGCQIQRTLTFGLTLRKKYFTRGVFFMFLKYFLVSSCSSRASGTLSEQLHHHLRHPKAAECQVHHSASEGNKADMESGLSIVSFVRFTIYCWGWSSRLPYRGFGAWKLPLSHEDTDKDTKYR